MGCIKWKSAIEQLQNALKNIDCRYSLEPPQRGGSNEYPQSMFWADTDPPVHVQSIISLFIHPAI